MKEKNSQSIKFTDKFSKEQLNSISNDANTSDLNNTRHQNSIKPFELRLDYL